MNQGRLSLMAFVFAFVIMVSPFAVVESSEGTYGSEKDPISLIPVGGTEPFISIDSGEEGSTIVYAVNNSGSPLHIDATVSGLGDDVVWSADVTVDGRPANLVPSGSDNSPGYATVTITIGSDRYADAGTFDAVITVRAIDITDPDASVFTSALPLTVSVTSVVSSDDSFNCFFGVFPNTFDGLLGEAWFAAIATFIVWILATFVVSRLAIPLFTRLVGDRKTDEEKRRLRNGLTNAITGLMVVIAVQECAEIVGAGPRIIDLIASVSWAFYIVFGAIIAWQVYLFIVTAFLKGLDKVSDAEGADMSLYPLFRMIGGIAIAVVACCAILSRFGVDLAGILVSAGVITLGITLGAQNILNQFFSGMVLLATRPFKKGDFVTINGETYTVEKVKVMFTEFKNWDGDQIVTMPNNAVSSATIQNLTKENPWTRISVFVRVPYGTDVELCKSCLVAAAKKHPNVICDGRTSMPSPRLSEFGESGLIFKLAVWVDDFDSSSFFAGQIRELIFAELGENGIEVQCKTVNVEILGDDRRPHRVWMSDPCHFDDLERPSDISYRMERTHAPGPWRWPGMHRLLLGGGRVGSIVIAASGMEPGFNVPSPSPCMIVSTGCGQMPRSAITAPHPLRHRAVSHHCHHSGSPRRS